jgi:two-component system chemotaxis response regulator CheY
MLVSAVGRIDDVRVTEAADGIDALRKLASQRFDLIMTDINMPVMDGLKLIKRVRDDARHQNVPIAVISTESADADRERAMALGANAYLIKPVQAEQVIACITQLLTGAGATDGG